MYLVLSGTLKKKIRYGKASPWCCFHVSIFPIYKPPFLSPLFSGVCVVPGPLSCQLLCPGGELHKDLQHDSFLNLLPTVPNQPLIMRHVQQENNVAHSLSDWQMRQSLPTHWYVNQPVAFEMLLGFFSPLCGFTEPSQSIIVRFEFCWHLIMAFFLSLNSLLVVRWDFICAGYK